MNSSRRTGGAAARVAAALALTATLLLAGCHNFFVCQKASCPSSGTGTGTGTGTGSAAGDFVYVSNSTAGASYVAGYDISNGSLTETPNSPYPINFSPVALAVSPHDGFLYAATPAGDRNPGIYAFTIDPSTGQIASAFSGNLLVTAAVSSMDISPDGGYLFVVNAAASPSSMTEYTVNTSTGALTPAITVGLPNSTCAVSLGTPVSQTCSVKVAPSGDFVVVSLGTAGTAIFPYSSSSGITNLAYKLIPPVSNIVGDYSVTLDSSRRIYIARTDALAVYQIASTAGDANFVTSQSYASGLTPRSVVLSSGGSYVYTANQGAGTISAFSIQTDGTLSALSGSPFTGPDNVSALGVDKSGTYMVAAGYNGSSGVQLFRIGTDGALTAAASAGTGTSTAYPVVLAMTH